VVRSAASIVLWAAALLGAFTIGLLYITACIAALAASSQ